MNAWEIWDWKGEEGRCVTVCDKPALERLTGLRGPQLLTWLRAQREAEVLVHNRGRLQQTVKVRDDRFIDGYRRERLYAFRCRLDDLAVAKVA